MSDRERDENQEIVGAPTATLDVTPELSIVMPCLNEAETLGTCIQKAQAFLHRYQVTGEIVVADNGPGISAADRDKLFMPYYSTKRRGSGLGLAIVRRIIVEHGGSIEVHDNQPKGTRFVIELPL